jgi:magnesium-transporting ATPase (P-type)
MIHNQIMTFGCDHNTQPDNDIQVWSWYTSRKWHSAVIMITTECHYLDVHHDHTWMSLSGCVSWSQLNVIIWLCIMITAECHCLVVYHDHSWMSLSGCVSWSQLNVIIWLCIMITAECHCLVVYYDHSWMSLSAQPDNDIQLWSLFTAR